jgi:hypothetical protein
VQCRIKRTFLDAERAIRSRLDMERDSETVIGSSGEGLEDEQNEGPLKVVWSESHSFRFTLAC